MAGLKICTRWRAISARRNRRISSSLLPENIGPTTTSIQPMLPLTMSTVAPSIFGSTSAGARWIVPLHLRTHGGGTIHLGIIIRREGRNHGNSKGFLPCDEIVREHAPGALRVTDPHGSSKAVDRCGKLQAIFENFGRHCFRQPYASEPPQ